MEDKNFIQIAQEIMSELQTSTKEINERARVATRVLKLFKTTLLEFLVQSTEERIVFTRNQVIQEECDYDLRQEMSDEIIVDALHKGYKYLEQESTSGKLVFKKIISH